MEKWNLVIDVELCENCNNCVLSTKDEHVGNEFEGYSAPAAEEGAELISITRNVRGQAPVVDTAYLVSMCNHCDNPPCKKVGGDAVQKRDDGIVIMDPVKAKGREDIARSCPYGAIVWNGQRQLPQSWYFDAHLLDQGWSKPRCVQSCPTGALEAIRVTDSDMRKRVDEENLQVLKPELKTMPRVYYRNLYRYTECFIGGTVTTSVEGVQECVQGAQVTLFQRDRQLGETETDAFGEFKLDKLPPGSGAYTVLIAHAEHGKSSVETKLDESLYLGEIKLM
ncbi:MAG: 4Fe-4S dicluster domain-containing protein [Pseudomonadales bacterium]